MVKVVLAWEVCQQQCLWVGSKCFAQVFVILSWEGTMLCTGKAQSGGVQVFCAVQLSWRTWWKPEMMPRALLSHALWKKGAWPQGLGPESARTSRDACDLPEEGSRFWRTKESSFCLSKVAAGRVMYLYPRQTEEGDVGTGSQDCQGQKHHKMNDVHSCF